MCWSTDVWHVQSAQCLVTMYDHVLVSQGHVIGWGHVTSKVQRGHVIGQVMPSHGHVPVSQGHVWVSEFVLLGYSFA